MGASFAAHLVMHVARARTPCIRRFAGCQAEDVIDQALIEKVREQPSSGFMVQLRSPEALEARRDNSLLLRLPIPFPTHLSLGGTTLVIEADGPLLKFAL
ncbi:unnamed protein product [Polarella glacialis]|uniref:Uncharacterized protein n=1 Tax=Polarella glacialis TaxID=89957 RepID=A0A813EDB7_POLGL|nr:unnamed protein product [Polarella glacialis]